MADFEIENEFAQGITLDMFPHVPATFPSRKSQSNRFQTEHHEIMHKNQFEGKKGERGERSCNSRTAATRITSKARN
jgi:hypothetical protein